MSDINVLLQNMSEYIKHMSEREVLLQNMSQYIKHVYEQERSIVIREREWGKSKERSFFNVSFVII